MGTTTDSLLSLKGSAVAQFCGQPYKDSNVEIFVFRRQTTSVLKREIVLILKQSVGQTKHV